MKYELKLIIDRDQPSPKVLVEDLSNPGTPPASLDFGAHAELPFEFAIHESPVQAGQLLVRPNEPFDPQVTRDSNVLEIETSISDHRFGTQDDTKYILHITNKSRYYLAEDIHVRAILGQEAMSGPQDGNPALRGRPTERYEGIVARKGEGAVHCTVTEPDRRHDFRSSSVGCPLSLSPSEQHIQCINPGQSKDLVFVAISRGPAPGLYTVIVTIDYRLLYWDGRRARDTSKHILPVQGDDLHHAFSSSTREARMPRQPKATVRSNLMSKEQESKVFFAPLPTKTHHHHHLKPIEQHFPLPGGGHLGVSYRLLKGHQRDGEHGSCTYGQHPDTHDVESYFSTQDTASLELILHNESEHHLKHVHISNIRLMSVNPETKSFTDVAEAKLPDGNLLFEILPSEAYYGHLSPHERETRYLSLITRGVAPGHYAVQLIAHYDIEQCHLPVDLWLTVRPD